MSRSSPRPQSCPCSSSPWPPRIVEERFNPYLLPKLPQLPGQVCKRCLRGSLCPVQHLRRFLLEPQHSPRRFFDPFGELAVSLRRHKQLFGSLGNVILAMADQAKIAARANVLDRGLPDLSGRQNSAHLKIIGHDQIEVSNALAQNIGDPNL